MGSESVNGLLASHHPQFLSIIKGNQSTDPLDQLTPQMVGQLTLLVLGIRKKWIANPYRPHQSPAPNALTPWVLRPTGRGSGDSRGGVQLTQGVS